MKTIGFIGSVDKRILVYTLARALSIENNVAIVADDGAYRRLYSGTEDCGTIGRVDIYVDTKFREEITHTLSDSGMAYDYRLAVSHHIIPEQCDYVIYCRGLDRTLCPEEEISVVEELPHTEVIISYEAPESKSVAAISIQDSLIKYLFKVEETKQISRILDKNINNYLAKILSNATGMSAGQMFNLLTRKDSWESKK